MSGMTLTGLDGSNPLAFLAALGVLVALDEAGVPARMRWERVGSWRPVLEGGPATMDELVALLEADRQRCADSKTLRFSYDKDGAVEQDLKPRPEQLRAVLVHRAGEVTPQSRGDLDWFCGMVAEGATDNNGAAKPSALHFLAGQQRFLKAALQLAEGARPADLHEALQGPWSSSSTLPVMGWDNTEARDYALRKSNPAKEKKLGNPGADWLALRGLAFFVVSAAEGDLRTPGVRGRWKTSTLAWPLWTAAAGRPVVQALLVQRNLRALPAAHRQRRGIGALFEARILRSDQGGYGSFSPPALL